MNIKERFENVGFTPEEKLELTARLERAAEQEENMTDATKRRIKRISGGMIFGIAAAVVMTAGALAAALNPGLRTWFDTTAPGAPEALEGAIYRIDRSQTYNGWTVTLAECAGDDSSAYIWADITAPEGTVLAPPENGWLGVSGWVESTNAGSGSTLQPKDNNPADNRISAVLKVKAKELRGDTVRIAFSPIVDEWYTEDPETGDGQWHKGSELTAAIRDHEWIFEDVKLDYPDQTIRLEPNVEVPWLDGAAMVTGLTISPLSTSVTLEGGSCASYVDLDRTSSGAEDGEIVISSGGLVITGSEGVSSGDDWFHREREMEEELTIVLTLKDGTQVTPFNLMEVDSGHREVSEAPYVSIGREYNEELWKNMTTRVLDPAQVDHVTICGVDIPLHLEDGAK